MADAEKLAVFGASLEQLGEVGARAAFALSTPIGVVKLADLIAAVTGERLGELIVQLNLIELERRG